MADFSGDYPVKVEQQLRRLNTRADGTVLPRDQWWGDADLIKRGIHHVRGFQHVELHEPDSRNEPRRAVYGPQHPGMVNMRQMYNLPEPDPKSYSYKSYAPDSEAHAHHQVQGRPVPHAAPEAGHPPASKPRAGILGSFLQGFLRR